MTLLTLGAAILRTGQRPSPELKLEMTILVGAALIAAVCTANITVLINRNTKAVLRAISALHRM